MISRFLIIFLFSCFFGVAHAAEPAFFQGKSFIIPTVTAGDMFKQCSRETPKAVDGYWQPSPAQVAQMETYLAAYMTGNPLQFASTRPYNRQYMGFKRKEKLYIYGNFYPQVSDSQAGKQNELPVVICDGGAVFWGIVYEVSDHHFEPPAFNGPEPVHPF